MGALSFGHLPSIFVPAGPMPSGIPNKEKARVRQAYAEGKATREELLDAGVQLLSLSWYLYLLWNRKQQPVSG